MNENEIITCACVTNPSHPVLACVERTYTDSFPLEERRDFSLVKELMQNNPAFSLYVFYRSGIYAGFLTIWDFGDFLYAEHFAISPEQRNGGVGSVAFGNFLQTLQKPLVLEVELPQDEWSTRRIGFYERLGFVLDSHVYVQPPYRPGGASLEMRLMRYGSLDLERTFDQVRDMLYRNVYGVSRE